MKATFDSGSSDSRIGRRDLLRLGGVGLGWLGLGAADPGCRSRRARAAGPVDHLAPLGRRASQLETWDPKPDAPSEVRGPFEIDRDPLSRRSDLRASAAPRRCGWIAWRSFGLFITKKPRSTRQAASFSRPVGCAESASKPPISARWSHMSGGARNGLPASVLLPGPIRSTGIDIPHGQASGWLGAACAPFAQVAGPMAPTSTRARSWLGHELARVNQSRVPSAIIPSTWPPSRRRCAMSTVAHRSGRAVCWPVGWSRRASAS